MTRFRMRSAVAVTTSALLAAGGAAAFALPTANAAVPAASIPADDPPPVPDGNSPGTGGDAYKSDDPFVDHGTAPTKIAPGSIVAQSFQLYPKVLKVKPGQKITFDNQDIAIHNIQTLKGKVKIKSPDADPGKKVVFKAPKVAAKYPVGCYYHQAMLMKIVVVGKGAKKG